jgi:hypothetical protein
MVFWHKNTILRILDYGFNLDSVTKHDKGVK